MNTLAIIGLVVSHGLVAWGALLVGRKNPKVADVAQQAADATKAGVDKLKS